MANGKAVAQAAAQKEETQQWEDFKRQVAETTGVFGFLIFIPAIIVIGAAYGIRAGVIAGTAKTLSMFKSM